MAIVLPAFNPTAGIPQAIQFAAQQFQQRKQRRQQAADTQALLQFIQAQRQGLNPVLPQFRGPQAGAALAGILGQQQRQPGFTLGPGQQRFGAAGQPIAQVAPAPVLPTQEIAQIRLDEFNRLVEKEKTTPLTPPERAFKEKFLIPSGQTINIGDAKVVTNSLALGRSFRTDERIKDMRTIEKFTQNMVTSLKRAERRGINLGPIDIALAKSFQKLTDLGSTVREGEFATTFEGQRLINKIRGKAQAVITGGLGFTPEDRKELVDLALALQEDSKKLFNQAITEFTTTSDELSLNTRAVLGGVKPFVLDDEELLLTDKPISGDDTLAAIDREIAELQAQLQQQPVAQPTPITEPLIEGEILPVAKAPTRVPMLDSKGALIQVPVKDIRKRLAQRFTLPSGSKIRIGKNTTKQDQTIKGLTVRPGQEIISFDEGRTWQLIP